jgi:hypothetical protein
LIQRNKWPAVLPGYFDVNKRVALITGASRGLGCDGRGVSAVRKNQLSPPCDTIALAALATA